MLSQDLAFGFRALRRTPTLAAAAVLTLALGIGLNTAIFSVVEAVLLNRLPYHDPSRIVTLTRADPAVTNADRVSLWTIAEWRRRSRSFESISAYDDWGLTLVENGSAEVLRGMRVSSEFFDTLGVGMLLGRALLPDEDRSPRANVIVLTHPLWAHRFGADPAIVGRVLRLDGQDYRVIGVLPRDFHPLRMTNAAETPQFFAPLGYNARQAAACRTCSGQRVIARLKPFITPPQATSELNAVTHEMVREYPADYPRDMTVRVDPLRDVLVRPVRTSLWMLSAAVACVLLIACANVASLQLVRANARTREFAVRAALGGAPSRLIAQSLVENLVLALIGGAAGMVVGVAATSVIGSWAPPELPRLDELRVDGGVLLFTLACTLLTGLVFGMVPAWSASRVDVNQALKSTAGVAGRSSGGRARSTLVILDIALAFVLIVVTGLLGRSVRNLESANAGFDAHGVLTLTPVLSASDRCATAERRLACYRQIIEKVEAVPGVTAAAMVSNVPLSHAEPMKVRVEGEPAVSDADAPIADTFLVSPDYFRVLRIPLQRGRMLTDRDGVDAPPAVLVSESFARARFGSIDAVGRRIQIGLQEDHGPWLTVAGVVGDVRYDRLDLEPRQAIYEPHAMNPLHYTRLVARTSGDPWRFEQAIRAAIHDFDPLAAVFHVQPMDDYVASSLADRTFALTLIACFGALALLLSAIGVYGLISYSLAQRAPEIGIRAALGATSGHLMALILKEGIAVLSVGLALGVAGGLGASRMLASSLFGVGSWDPATHIGAAGLLALVALLASLIGARAITRIDPLTALKSE
jgi:putative ABC transport system permease protein